MMNLEIVEGNLLDQDVDVIVNTWSRNIIPWWLLLPQGVSGAIKKHAGYGPFRELRKRGSILLGQAVMTEAGKLPHKPLFTLRESICCSVRVNTPSMIQSRTPWWLRKSGISIISRKLKTS